MVSYTSLVLMHSLLAQHKGARGQSSREPESTPFRFKITHVVTLCGMFKEAGANGSSWTIGYDRQACQDVFRRTATFYSFKQSPKPLLCFNSLGRDTSPTAPFSRVVIGASQGLALRRHQSQWNFSLGIQPMSSSASIYESLKNIESSVLINL